MPLIILRMNDHPHITPDGLALPDRAAADRILRAIASEGEQRGVDLTSPSHFLQLGEVGLALQEMQGGGRGREAVQGLGALLFHTFHFRRCGECVLAVGREDAQTIVDPAGADEMHAWEGGLPSDSGYIRLPRNLFWSAPGEDRGAEGAPVPAEAIDGIFWTASAEGALSLALISGIIVGRPGFTIFELPPVPLGDAPRWSRLQVRREGEDFATTLPGGELGGLHTILEFGEVLKLVSRVFALHAGRGSGNPDDVDGGRDQGKRSAEDEVAT